MLGAWIKERKEKQAKSASEGDKLNSIENHLQHRIETKAQRKAKLQHSLDFAVVGLLPTHSVQQLSKQSSGAMLPDFK